MKSFGDLSAMMTVLLQMQEKVVQKRIQDPVMCDYTTKVVHRIRLIYARTHKNHCVISAGSGSISPGYLRQ